MQGGKDPEIVRTLKRRLNAVLALQYDPLRLDIDCTEFGPKMLQVVKLFQARNVDSNGNPLLTDGEIGPLTWSALFGIEAVPTRSTAQSELLDAVLDLAAGEVSRRVREVPKNSNSGPRVNEYLSSAGLGPGNAWGCAFVYWCFREASRTRRRPNPMPKTARSSNHWQLAAEVGGGRVERSTAVNNPGAIRPGMVFIMDWGEGVGHTGFVEEVEGGLITTIEGNTDGSGTREGSGVYRLTRKIAEVNTGFIDYSGV